MQPIRTKFPIKLNPIHKRYQPIYTYSKNIQLRTKSIHPFKPDSLADLVQVGTGAKVDICAKKADSNYRPYANFLNYFLCMGIRNTNKNTKILARPHVYAVLNNVVFKIKRAVTKTMHPDKRLIRKKVRNKIK